VRHACLLSTLVVVLCVCPLGGTQRGSSALTIRVAVSRTSFRPGSVGLVTVTPSRAIASVSGEAFDRRIDFFPEPGGRRWQAVVGVPLETKPGTYTLSMQATADDGTAAGTRQRLTVARAQYETRRLTVDESFVNPPDSTAERIAREAKVLADTFARTTGERIWSGPFTVPVEGRATSSFGRLTVLNGQPRGRHQGADFRAAVGTPIRAPNAGIVVVAEDYYFSGNTVILDHGGGLYSLFAHLSRIEVAVGSRVARGDLIGDAGATGRVTGPHLHWAVRLRNDTVDPLSLVAATAKLPAEEPVTNASKTTTESGRIP
jgi:surface-anchored protein